MLHKETLLEISNNINTGVEYEIGLFFKLLKNQPDEQSRVMSALSKRADASKIKSIISETDTSIIEKNLRELGMKLYDASFETQNDEVGPADIIMYVKSNHGKPKKIGLSVKYANTCTLNVTGRRFLTDNQILDLRSQLSLYTDKYIKEMTNLYGDVTNWFRKRKKSTTTNAYIDLIRDAVIENWPHVKDKATLLNILFHGDSPIKFWVVTYGNNGYYLNTKPQTIDCRRAEDVKVLKHQSSFVGFYLDGLMIAKMQVKFNNGFVEKCKKRDPDLVCQGTKIKYGNPFGSWNFSVKNE